MDLREGACYYENIDWPHTVGGRLGSDDELLNKKGRKVSDGVFKPLTPLYFWTRRIFTTRAEVAANNGFGIKTRLWKYLVRKSSTRVQVADLGLIRGLEARKKVV